MVRRATGLETTQHSSFVNAALHMQPRTDARLVQPVMATNPQQGGSSD